MAQPVTNLALKTPEGEAPKGEHIFHAKYLTKLALEWKELNAKGKHKEAMPILEIIVIGTTNMLERLAQHEGFHHTVDLETLIVAAQEKIVKWLLYWNPDKGSLFSFFSRCGANAFRSEALRVQVYRSRTHTTSENLDKYYGSEDTVIEKKEILKEMENALRVISVRWGDPQELGAVKFLVECIIDPEYDKTKAIRTAAFAYGISPDMAKFFHAWALVALRNIYYERTYVPFSEQDLLRNRESYSLIVDMMDTVMPWPQMRKFIALYGGMRIKVPTMNQLAKAKEDHEIFKEIEAGDKDPESVEKVGKKHGKSAKSAQEIFEEQIALLHPKHSGEHDLYE